VFVIAGTVTGSGSILANGGDGGDSNSNGSVSGDASGGGGGGGSVVVHAGALGRTSKSGEWRSGRHQININSNLEAEVLAWRAGGYVALSGGTPTTVTADGRFGRHDQRINRLYEPLSEFPSNGATAGQDGLIDATAASSMHYYTNPIVTMATKPTIPRVWA